MTITETMTFFKTLLKETKKKREIKIYKDFVGILSNLKSRDLSDHELMLIENEIEFLNLKSKHGNRKLNAFKTYLNKEFSLITEGYYTALGMSLGLCFGVAIGTTFGATGTSMGLAIVDLIGIVIGKSKDKVAERENRVLKPKTAEL